VPIDNRATVTEASMIDGVVTVLDVASTRH
jgi:hypothetical protein